MVVVVWMKRSEVVHICILVIAVVVQCGVVVEKARIHIIGCVLLVRIEVM